MIKEVLLVFILLSGCASVDKASLLVSNGSSKKEVMEAMGEPKDRQFKGENEAWQYCNLGFPNHDYKVVWFKNGKVTGVQSYKLYVPGYWCEKGFKTINWEEAPDAVIEIRER